MGQKMQEFRLLSATPIQNASASLGNFSFFPEAPPIKIAATCYPDRSCSTYSANLRFENLSRSGPTAGLSWTQPSIYYITYVMLSAVSVEGQTRTRREVPPQPATRIAFCSLFGTTKRRKAPRRVKRDRVFRAVLLFSFQSSASTAVHRVQQPMALSGVLLMITTKIC